MNAHECPSPEDLAVFAARTGTAASWRRVVRHLADCVLCRRQVELLDQVPDDSAGALPATTAPLPPPAGRPRVWQRVAQAVAAAAVVSAAIYFLVARPEPPRPVAEADPPPAAPDRTRPTRDEPRRRPVFPDFTPTPAPAPAPHPEPTRQERAPFFPAPKEPDEPREVAKVPSPFLAERAAPGVVEPIEVAVARGDLSRVSGGETSPLGEKSTLSASDSVRAPGGGSLVLPNGAMLHLARESEVGLSWSQTDACARVELRSGDAILDLGGGPRPVCLSSGPVALLLRDSSGRIWLSRGVSELRATPLTGAAAFRTPDGASRQLRALESLVLRSEGDRLEEAPDPSAALEPRFPTLRPSPAPEAPPAAPAAKNLPSEAELVEALAAQSYAYRVLGRNVRDGVWMPPDVVQSTMDDFTAVRRSNDGGALHVRRGLRAWDDLGKISSGSREARLVETVRRAPPPHAAIQELLPAARGEPQVKTEQVADRLCWVWELDLNPEAIHESVKTLFAAALADGRVKAPDFVYWDTLRGSLEFASPKTDPRLVRAVDRRRVSYSYKTIGGTDRRWYTLETVYEFSAHGQATLKLPAEMVRELFPARK